MDMSFHMFDAIEPVTPFWVGTSKLNVAAGGSNSLSAPTGFQSTDLALLFIACASGSAAHALPSGWTDLGTDASSTEASCRTCYKTGPAAVTITAPASRPTCAMMVVFRGVGAFPTTFYLSANLSNSIATIGGPNFVPAGEAQRPGVHVIFIAPQGVTGYATQRALLAPSYVLSKHRIAFALASFTSQANCAIFASAAWFMHGYHDGNWLNSSGQIFLDGTVANRVTSAVYVPGNRAT